MQIRIPRALALAATLVGCDASTPTATDLAGDAHVHGAMVARAARTAAEHILLAEAKAGYQRLDVARAAGYFQASPCVCRWWTAW